MWWYPFVTFLRTAFHCFFASSLFAHSFASFASSLPPRCISCPKIFAASFGSSASFNFLRRFLFVRSIPPTRPPSAPRRNLRLRIRREEERTFENTPFLSSCKDGVVYSFRSAFFKRFSR